MKNKSISYWIEHLNGYGVPCGKVNDIGESYMEPHIKQQVRQYTHPAYGSIKVPGSFFFCYSTVWYSVCLDCFIVKSLNQYSPYFDFLLVGLNVYPFKEKSNIIVF